jgi:hypothetical protein
MDKREVLWLVSIAILSIITTIIILCIIPLLGDAFIPVITIAFLAFVWWASNHG